MAAIFDSRSGFLSYLQFEHFLSIHLQPLGQVAPVSGVIQGIVMSGKLTCQKKSGMLNFPPYWKRGFKHKNFKEKACMTGQYRIRIYFLVLSGLLFLGVCGCTEVPETPGQEFVIKVGSNMVLPREFAEELDRKLAAYPYDLKKNPEEYNQMVFNLVSVLSEENILLAGAREKNILVTDSELAAAEALYREDYPEDSFEQMLLENAIPYQSWKKMLKKDLMIDKFIQVELRDKIEISPDDVVSFYTRHMSQESVADEKQLVSHLRLEKSEESYGEWITVLESRYPVEINKKALSLFLIDMKKE